MRHQVWGWDVWVKESQSSEREMDCYSFVHGNIAEVLRLVMLKNRLNCHPHHHDYHHHFYHTRQSMGRKKTRVAPIEHNQRQSSAAATTRGAQPFATKSISTASITTASRTTHPEKKIKVALKLSRRKELKKHQQQQRKKTPPLSIHLFSLLQKPSSSSSPFTWFVCHVVKCPCLCRVCCVRLPRWRIFFPLQRSPGVAVVSAAVSPPSCITFFTQLSFNTQPPRDPYSKWFMYWSLSIFTWYSL